MTQKTVSYVSASDVFDDFPDAWTAFCECQPDCSWGDNNVTLVTASTLLAAADDYPDELLAFIEAMGDMYVDLES